MDIEGASERLWKLTLTPRTLPLVDDDAPVPPP
jgi:hypothetical protein